MLFRSMRKKLLGAEHPDTLTSMSNLALTYSNQGNLNEAEQLNVEVLDMRKKLLGAEHPHTLKSMSNLALTYSSQGKFNEAEQLNEQEKDDTWCRTSSHPHKHVKSSIDILKSGKFE